MQLTLILKRVCVTDYIVDTSICKSEAGPSFSVPSQRARDWGARERQHTQSGMQLGAKSSEGGT